LPVRHGGLVTGAATAAGVDGLRGMACQTFVLDQLDLQAGAAVGLAVDHGCLVVNPSPRPRNSIEELRAASDYSRPPSADEREWVAGADVSRPV